MREQLIRRGVLTPPNKFSSGDFVEDARHLMERGIGIQDVAFQELDDLLQSVAEAAHDPDLMGAALGD